MRFLLCLVAMLLIVGCDYFDDSEDTLHDDSEDTLNPITYDSTPVVIPTDADWELIATLQHNPLYPTTFYIFPEQKEALNIAYADGKHFIFEIGKEHRDMYTDKIRHYIIQPTPPFQDEDKHPGQISQWEEDGVKFDVHRYSFLSEGWYSATDGQKWAVGLGVEFDLTHLKPTEEFPDDKRQTLHRVVIGLISQLDSPIIGRGGKSFIKADIRLRIYVSQ